MPSSIINSDNGVISGSSGLKTTGGDDGVLQIQTNGTTVASASASAFQVGGNNISAVNSMGFRNRIINGGMVIDQRNNGASVTITGTDVSQYTIDRWFIRAASATGSRISTQRSTVAPTGFTNSQLITSLSAYTIGATEHFGTMQSIEGFNVADLGWGTASAQSITVSFQVRSSLTGTFGGFITNEAGNRVYVFSYTVNSANTFETKSITIPGDTTGTWQTDNRVGVTIAFSVAAGSSTTGAAGSWGSTLFRSVTGQTSLVGTNGATFYITGVQLEAGSVATPFERRPYGAELALCQRYYEVGTSQFSNPMFSGYAVSGTTFYANGVFKVSKRAAPTVTLTNTFAAAFPSSSGVAQQISPESFYEPRIANSSDAGYFASTFTASAEL